MACRRSTTPRRRPYIGLMMGDAVTSFYDEFAQHYHLMFENWEASVTRQAAAIRSVLQRDCNLPDGARVLDCACGIGTQSLGLAKLGFRVTGSDVSAWRYSVRARKPPVGLSTWGFLSPTCESSMNFRPAVSTR
jgi:SAM-dependent methyltransferase